jgi:hypothetical protein
MTDSWVVVPPGSHTDYVVEVHRDPGPDASAPYGFRYRSVTTVAAPSLLAPLALPSIDIAVGDLLP